MGFSRCGRNRRENASHRRRDTPHPRAVQFRPVHVGVQIKGERPALVGIVAGIQPRLFRRRHPDSVFRREPEKQPRRDAQVLDVSQRTRIPAGNADFDRLQAASRNRPDQQMPAQGRSGRNIGRRIDSGADRRQGRRRQRIQPPFDLHQNPVGNPPLHFLVDSGIAQLPDQYAQIPQRKDSAELFRPLPEALLTINIHLWILYSVYSLCQCHRAGSIPRNVPARILTRLGPDRSIPAKRMDGKARRAFPISERSEWDASAFTLSSNAPVLVSPSGFNKTRSQPRPGRNINSIPPFPRSAHEPSGRATSSDDTITTSSL